jgi:hypothetical protein
LVAAGDRYELLLGVNGQAVFVAEERLRDTLGALQDVQEHSLTTLKDRVTLVGSCLGALVTCQQEIEGHPARQLVPALAFGRGLGDALDGPGGVLGALKEKGSARGAAKRVEHRH